ncbi:transcriptional regulatory [Absidia repens]|uniref:Transcriptional regulatory n=1 Tax=Absidia repens TaxID=90262 RepID=A0A1X2IXI8_9FUNG|nr:transcriptional regulatory [Absidia repens]
MNRNDLMRISKALAKFRPSFLVLIMNLTEEDLIFMEKCIQRTLMEYEKLISFSGTPTVVWRRTGEICLLGKEFCLLTQWTSKELLLDKKTYIYELMDCPSAVEYWEHFGRHAFDNTDTSRHYTCILQSPKKRPIPCTFCFMIKRDIFDLPSVIVGNFLPILS